MKIKSGMMVIITMVMIFGGIFLADRLGFWATENDRLSNGGGGQSSNSSLISDPADIRGSTTFATLLNSFPIDRSVLYQAFMIPETQDPALLRSGDLESLYEETSIEIGNESMKIFLALYLGLEIELESTGFPESAVELILEKQPGLDEATRIYLEEHTVPAKRIENPEIGEEVHEVSTEAESEHLIQINGSTLFQDLLEMGLSVEVIEEAFEESYPGDQVRVKDYIEGQGLEYSTMKKNLEALVTDGQE